MSIKVRSLSYSTVTQYCRCSESVWLDKIEHVPKQGSVSANLLNGSAIHAACSAWYRALATGQILSAEVLHRVYEIKFDATPAHEIDFGNKDREAMFTTAKALLTKLTEQPIPATIVGVEVPLRFQLANDLEVVGQADLLTRDSNGDLVITDWKTSSKTYGADDIHRVSTQLYLYALAVPREPVHLRAKVLIKKKNPSIQDLYLNPDDVNYSELRDTFLNVKKSIECGLHMKTRGWYCSSCGYRHLCDPAHQAMVEHELQQAA